MEIGFIGLGQMGNVMATNLVNAGHQVRVWNRSSEPLKQFLAKIKGAQAAANPAETAGGDFLITMLANDAAARSVIIDHGVLDAARPGLIHINMATVSVALAKEFAELHRKRNVGYIAAPVFGRPDAAAAAKLNIVVAGDPKAIARAEPILSVLGQKTWQVGDQEERANAVKIAGNFMIASAIETMGEAVAMTRAYGVAAGDFLDIMTNTLFAAPAYKIYGAMIAAERYQPAGFANTLAIKDIRLALSAADAKNVPMPFASVLRDSFMEALATGGENDDWGSLAKLAARRAGLDKS
jgi:3-hydroxyisobutyrate dehydrogenase-like beta-hydroxyacid dehydrogenase